MAPAEPVLRVQVVYGPQNAPVDVVDLELPPEATAATALHASGLLARHGLDASNLRFGVWGRVCAAAQRLRDRDRVEIYRPLRVDPKEARRQRLRRNPLSGSRKR